eukprot:Mrub_07246.p4 GENE.Mrub_07246~~Mrub_07246.p4  ORF type:complete len:161 (+),score=41.46 Mrub_07246:415-897(+)
MFVHLMRNVNHKHISCDDFKAFFRDWLEIEDPEVIDTIFRNSDFDDSKSVDVNEFVYAFMCEHYFKYNIEKKRDVDYLMKSRMHSINQYYQGLYSAVKFRARGGQRSVDSLTNRIKTKGSSLGGTFYDKMYTTNHTFYGGSDVEVNRKDDYYEDLVPEVK